MTLTSWHWFSVPQRKSQDILCQMSWHKSRDIGALAFYQKLTFGGDYGKWSKYRRSIFVKWHRSTYLFIWIVSSLFENLYETPGKHRCGNVLTRTCDVTMHKIVVPYNTTRDFSSVDKMVIILHGVVSNWFSFVKYIVYASNFHWSLFSRIQIQRWFK